MTWTFSFQNMLAKLVAGNVQPKVKGDRRLPLLWLWLQLLLHSAAASNQQCLPRHT